MKKSDIYKMALVATISKMVMDNDLDPDKVYEVANEITDTISTKTFVENEESAKSAGGNISV